MDTATQAANPKWMTVTGRVISGVMIAMLTFSATVKLAALADVQTELVRLGYWQEFNLALGILEAACTVFYAIPQTAVLGAILLTGYLGGAVATHVQLHEMYVGPVVIGALVWLGIWFRDPRLRALVPWRR